MPTDADTAANDYARQRLEEIKQQPILRTDDVLLFDVLAIAFMKGAVWQQAYDSAKVKEAFNAR